MIKYLKKLWKKFFGKTSKTLPENIGEEPTRDLAGTGSDLGLEPLVLKLKPLHCANHTRFKKSCPGCLAAVGVK